MLFIGCAPMHNFELGIRNFGHASVSTSTIERTIKKAHKLCAFFIRHLLGNSKLIVRLELPKLHTQDTSLVVFHKVHLHLPH